MLLTLDSSGRVLDLFTADTPEWGVTETARHLGLSKSKAHALLASLATIGLLRRTERGRYRLGWRVAALGRVLAETTDFHRAARPVIGALSVRLNETAELAVLDGDEVTYLDRIQGRSRSACQTATLARTLPASSTAAGKVLLAGRERFSPHGGAAVAVDLEETVDGLWCIAAPVIAPAGGTIAAISISAPTARFDARHHIYELAVVRAGSYVTRQLRDWTVIPLALARLQNRER